MRSLDSILAVATTLAAFTAAGFIGYGVCQAGCLTVVMACSDAAGFTWGATMAAIAPMSGSLCERIIGTYSFNSPLEIPVRSIVRSVNR